MNEIFIKNLKNLRKEYNQTQKNMAELLNMSATGYASWEQGLSEPNMQALIIISNFFSCSIDELVGRNQVDNQGISGNISNSSFNMSVGKASGTIENFTLNHKMKKGK